MNKKWSTQEIFKFLEAYEENSWLWDVNSELYKNREAREIAYENMARSMHMDGFGIPEVKAKIRSLRNAYTLELAKIEKSKKLGTGIDIYKPRVPWFAMADKILHNVVHISDPQTAKVENIKLENIITESPKLFRRRKVKRKSEHTNETNKRKILVEESAEPIRLKPQGIIESTEEELPKISRRFNIPTDREDEFECFGKCIASQLRKLPEPSALKSMAFIQSYLVKQRLKSCAQNVGQQRFNSGDSSYSEENIIIPTEAF